MPWPSSRNVRRGGHASSVRHQASWPPTGLASPAAVSGSAARPAGPADLAAPAARACRAGAAAAHGRSHVADGVAAQVRQQGVGQGQRQHGLAHHGGARHDGHVAALDVGAAHLAGLEVHGLERLAQRGHRLHGDARHDRRAVAHAALRAAGAVRLACPAGGARDDLVVDGAAAPAHDAEAEADLHALDGLDAHEHGRDGRVQARVPLGVGADAHGHALGHDHERAADRVAGLDGRVDLGHHGRLGHGVRAAQRRRGAPVRIGPAGRDERHGVVRAVEGAHGAELVDEATRCVTPHVASSWRQTAPAATRGAVERAEARSRTSRMSPRVVLDGARQVGVAGAGQRDGPWALRRGVAARPTCARTSRPSRGWGC